MRKDFAITEDVLQESSQCYRTGPLKNISDSVMKNGIAGTAFSREASVRMSRLFSDEIEPMEITNQKKSGRCWIFAGMNVLRYRLNKTLHFKTPDFELSQTYIMFWDKLEKANYFLESVIETANEGKGSRIVMWLFDHLLGDGGQWDMLVSVIKKYGVLPQYAMPETSPSSNSSRMNGILCKKLRRDGIMLRRMAEAGKREDRLRAEKMDMLREFYGLLCCFLGEPPRTFDFEYRDKENRFHRDRGLTPLQFYKKYFGAFLDDYVSVINAPTEDKPFGRTYSVQYLGNVVEGRPVVYLNLEASELERMACRQIRDGDPVWFGSDVGKMSDGDLGIMDTSLYRYEDVLNTELGMSKADMLDYGQSYLTHAMMLLGVNLTESGATKWKVENSWGKDVGEKGFFVMSSDWFREYVCQVVVDKKYLSEDQKAALEREPAELAPWDPIGSLAIMR
ncbi:aminopeptidase [Caproiciproducens sp. NJN-50]|uniref:aminopeptidase C n=2 Tax=Acutalibacteraceae TaxID=3082771 RepID=UPI000FFE0DE9|nr:C1 family peptidase [Caproiciproducens sp. NJN-50]QAT50744.1 aminopeptidase [Caproiciproducens sp. NJN-50]